ncbi:uncharacterized protein TNCV_2338811 [Trichonephila clavipes]|nr:uncharacterized protein TNCV_2338811 [Trichonephila clavipes]
MTRLAYFNHNYFLSNYIQKRIRFLGRKKQLLVAGAISHFLLTRVITSFVNFHHVEAKGYKLHCKLQVKSPTEVGNREDAKFFKVDESNIRLWRKNKTKLENYDRRLRADRRGKPHWPEFEEETNKWILKERDNGKAVSILIFLL